MKDQLRGCVKINAGGKQLYQFINELHSRKIAIFRQYVKGGKLSAEIYRHDLEAVQELAGKYSLELTFFEYDTLSREVRKRHRRLGILIGAVLILGASLYFSSVIVTIDIQGNSTVSDSVILSALAELGIEEGTHFGQIDYVNAENQLHLMVEKLSWVGMHRTGHRLVVEVTEVVEKPEMLHDRIPCNIVAAHDAEIVGISVLDGQLMHMIGDYVFAGDLLISGVTSDPLGHITLHHSMGDIVGIYEENVSFSGEFTRSRMINTGRTDKRCSLHLFDLEIPLYFGKNRFEYRETELTEKPLYIMGKKLPISLKTAKYREMKHSEDAVSEEKLRQELNEKIYLYEKNFLGSCEIIDRSISENSDENKLTLNVCYRLKGDICEEREILIK